MVVGRKKCGDGTRERCLCPNWPLDWATDGRITSRRPGGGHSTDWASVLLASSHLRIMLLLTLLRCSSLAYGGCVSRPARTASVPLCIAGHVDVSIYGRLESRSGLEIVPDWPLSRLSRFASVSHHSLRLSALEIWLVLCLAIGGRSTWSGGWSPGHRGSQHKSHRIDVACA